MKFPLFDAPLREPSQFVTFAGNVVDRQSENRSDDSAMQALADPTARILLIRNGRVCLGHAGDGFEAHHGIAELEGLGGRAESCVLLGWNGSGPILAGVPGVEPDDLPEPFKAIDLRSVYTQGLVDAETLGEIAQGAALLSWHSTHRFCGRCGGATQMRAGGYKRVCPQCGAEHFPRTDPVAIMLAVTRDKCLLGRSPHFRPGMYSALAGFIEPGETIEAAVRRETLEESGIRLGRVVYHASQPWPFPYSLMIGCFGEALNEDIVRDTIELEDCRWFSREDVKAMIAETHPEAITVPPRMAIASHLIHAWADSE
jgi:NAD+ diphosphatase